MMKMRLIRLEQSKGRDSTEEKREKRSRDHPNRNIGIEPNELTLIRSASFDRLALLIPSFDRLLYGLLYSMGTGAADSLPINWRRGNPSFWSRDSEKEGYSFRKNREMLQKLVIHVPFKFPPLFYGWTSLMEEWNMWLGTDTFLVVIHCFFTSYNRTHLDWIRRISQGSQRFREENHGKCQLMRVVPRITLNV